MLESVAGAAAAVWAAVGLGSGKSRAGSDGLGMTLMTDS